MRLRLCPPLLFVGLVFAAAFAAHAGEALPPPADLLCANAPAGTVEEVPPPFNLWLVVVCAPQSQALVPVEGTIWFAHGTVEPVSILALPPAATPVPPSEGYNPSYSVRFKALYAAEAKGAKRARAMKLLEAAMSKDVPRKMPKIEHVFQLDAVSIIYDMRYNIYFYVAGNRPRAAIACIDECSQVLFFDILTVDEAKARLSAR
ncbi:MAG: hypothetical protein K8R18_08930 [Parvibaculum sp.]|uniref:hypothetical protein n=1 Tax=Parvibaculum sp. TaxID=2024848 RepID=UPI0025E5D41C|nr:hypothetical protein [Parvibaculum sp.]MCE9649732.1 hypothetical protein [Parvibaculum sp.]